MAVLSKAIPALLVLHALLGAEADPGAVLFMVPLQFAVSVLMLGTAFEIVTASGYRSSVSVCLLAFALMELMTIGVRLRVNARRGASRAWRLPSGGGVVSSRGAVLSGVFAAAYLAGAASLLLSNR